MSCYWYHTPKKKDSKVLVAFLVIEVKLTSSTGDKQNNVLDATLFPEAFLSQPTTFPKHNLMIVKNVFTEWEHRPGSTDSAYQTHR